MNDASILSDSNDFGLGGDAAAAVALAAAESFFENPVSGRDSFVGSELPLDLDVEVEKAKAVAVLREALANSDSLYRLCEELNGDSSCEDLENPEPLEELYISEGASSLLINDACL